MPDNTENNDSKEELNHEAAFESSEIHKEAPKTVNVSDMELENLRRECADYKDKYQRALAESENIRKRMQKERQELIQYAVQNIITDFLNPIDHMENALKFTQQASPEIKNWAMGFQMILNQFKDTLSNNGVVAFSSEGTPFDPHLHEAIEMIETTEFSPGSIVSESLKGYKMGERIIRHARVSVAKAPLQAGNQDKTCEAPENECEHCSEGPAAS